MDRHLFNKIIHNLCFIVLISLFASNLYAEDTSITYTKDERCGVDFFSTSEHDKFQYCCVVHDRLYESSHMGFGLPTSEFADKSLLDCMLKQANTRRLKARAYVYYDIVKVVGPRIWGYRPGYAIKNMPPY